MDNRMQCFSLLSQYVPVFLDTETTGLDTTAEVLEISVVDWNGNVLLDTLVKPKGLISPAASAIHGITAEMVANAPTWPEVLPQLQQVLADKMGVTYNAAFDLRMMLQSSEAWGLTPEPCFGAKTFFCAMLEYAHWRNLPDFYRKRNKWIKLEEACRHEGVVLLNAHRALADCYMTLNLVRAVLHKIYYQNMTR
jgi:DNA polymerase-3 subunit epsilon